MIRLFEESLSDPLQERSIGVVVLSRDDSGQVRPVLGGAPVDLASTTELSEEVVAELRASSVLLVAPDEVPAEAADVLAGTSVPPAFRTSPWLREYRALVVHDGRCQVGLFAFGYDKRFGVYLGNTSQIAGKAVAFNLVSRPWIPVIRHDDGPDVVSLRQLLLGAHRIHRIVGETPPMTAALYRLVLALVHRAYRPIDLARWARLWHAETLPAEPIERYLETYSDRFDLFHPQRPFLQCPEVSSSGRSSLAKLVPHRAVGNNATLFDHTTATDRVVLTPAEAARWLVTLQAYDPGGLKTPYRKDKSSERAPGNSFGVALMEGGTLKETLLLNTLEYDPEREKPTTTTRPDDRPVWEDPQPPRPEPDQRSPRGWTDLLTWPSRRAWLSTAQTSDGMVVDGVVITPGTRLRGELSDMELMGAFRRPTTPGGKPKKNAPLLPIRLNQVRGIWRYSVELLLAGDDHRQRPEACEHIAELVEAGHIDEHAIYTLRVFGQQLDNKGGAVEAWAEETVPVPVALLRSRAEELGGIIGLAVQLADDVGSALRALERDYRAEFRAVPSAELELVYWPRLPRPFAVFLRDLAEVHRTGRSEAGAADTWSQAVERIARRAADRWAEGSPRQGRNLLSAGNQHIRFTGLLHGLIATFHDAVRAYITREEVA